MLECKMGGECGVWEGMEGGVVWSGMREEEGQIKKREGRDERRKERAGKVREGK